MRTEAARVLDPQSPLYVTAVIPYLPRSIIGESDMCARAAQSVAGLVAVIALAGSPAAAQSAPPATQPPLFQMRMASETPQPGFERKEQLMGGIPAYISPVDVVSDDMIRHVTSKRTDDGLVLRVLFFEEGRRRLETATRERTSSHMALLLDSEIVVFAVIQSTLSRIETDIGLKLPPDKVDHYRAMIAEKWPPSPVRSPQSVNLRPNSSIPPAPRPSPPSAPVPL